MFFQEKEFQLNKGVSKPDIRLTKLLLQQFSGPFGKLRQTDDKLFKIAQSIKFEDAQEDTDTIE